MQAKSKPFILQIEDGSHRQSDWLELFFDLAFVICIGVLSHHLASGSSLSDAVSYVGYFVPVWWVWNQFTWYSTHFNNGDRWFRVFMFSGMAGSLALAASLKSHGHDHTAFICAYLFLHVVLLLGWLRAYFHIIQYRPYISLKILGISLGLCIWFASLFLNNPEWVWVIGLICQLSMPVFAWATVKNMISVHHTHLMERHGLFTIIVLGEGLFAIVEGFTAARELSNYLFLLVGFLSLAGLWWIYFEWDSRTVDLKGIVSSFTYNYGHFVLYCSLGMVAAGLNRLLVPELFPAPGLTLILTGIAAFLVSLVVMDRISKR